MNQKSVQKKYALALHMKPSQLAKISQSKEILLHMKEKVDLLKQQGFTKAIKNEENAVRVKLLYQFAKDRGCSLISKKGKRLYKWHIYDSYSNIHNTEVSMSPKQLGNDKHELVCLNPQKYVKHITLEALKALPPNFPTKGTLFGFRKYIWSRVKKSPIACMRIPTDIDGHQFYFGITRW